MHNYSLENRLNKIIDTVLTKPVWPNEIEYLNYHKVRFRKLIEMLESHVTPGAAILDVGCEPGIVSMILSDRYVCHGISIDVLETSRTRMHEYKINLHECNIETEAFPLSDESIDAVICSEVLEHLYLDPEQLFRQVNRVLRPRGIVIITTPNLARLRNRIKLLVGESIHGELGGDYGYYDRPIYHRHHREYTKDEVVFLLGKWGFETVQVQFDDVYSYQEASLLRTMREMFLKAIPIALPSLRQSVSVIGRKVSLVNSARESNTNVGKGVYGR